MPGKITYSRKGPRKGSRSIYKPQGARRVSRRRIYRYIPKMMGGATNDAVNPTATVNPTARAAALNQPELKNGVNALDGEGNPIATADTTKTEKSIFGEIADAGAGTFETAKRSFNDVAVGEGSQELGLKTEDKPVLPPGAQEQPVATMPEPGQETPVPEPETPVPEPETPAPEPETPAPEPETPAPEPETPEPETTKKPDESPGFLESAKRAIFGQNKEEKTEEPVSALTEPVDMLSPEGTEETASPITTTNVEVYEAKIEGLIEQINLEKEIVATKDQVIETQQKLIDALQGNQMAETSPTPVFEPEPNSMETSPTPVFEPEPNSMETSPTPEFASEPNSMETSPTPEFASEPNSTETSPSGFASEPNSMETSPTSEFASEPSQISQNELPQQEQPFVQNENEVPQQEQPMPNQFQNKITGGKSRRIRRTIRKSKRRPKYSYYYG